MKCTIATLAREIIIDRESGSPSIISLIDAIQAASFPVFISLTAFFVVHKEEHEDEVNKCQIKVSEDSEMRLTQEVIVDFKSLGKSNVMLRFENFPIRKSSTVKFELLGKDDSIIGSTEIRINPMNEKDLAQYKMVQVD